MKRCCASCAYWRPTAPVDMTKPSRDEDFEDVGACENVTPVVVVINNAPMTVQPTTHGTRCCADWSPVRIDGFDLDDDDDGDGGGDAPRSPHDPDKIRRLFPHPPKPVAA